LAKHSSPRPWIVWVTIAVGVAAFAAIGLGWSKHVSAAGAVVAGNVRYAGLAVEGLTPDELRPLVAERAVDLLNDDLTLVFGDDEVSVPFGQLGFSYGADETAEEIVAARHSGQPWDQFAAWVAGPLLEHDVDESWSFDPELAMATLAGLAEMRPNPAVEPGLVSGENGMEVVPGDPGVIVDIDSIVDALENVDLLEPPSSVEGDLIGEPPAISDDDALDLAESLNSVTRDGVLVSVNGHSRLISAEDLRERLIVGSGADGLETSFNQVSLQRLLEDKFPEPVTEFVAPVMTVEGGVPTVVTPGKPYLVCCSADAAEQVATAVLAGSDEAQVLQPAPADDPTVEAWADGSMVTELIGEFTTHHPCCESRVTNIHRIADLVRGSYILPGETLSINELVGPRTVAGGFVRAGAIRQGHMVLEVGGGVSQFITTTFNAAYFAGLDFDEYRSHSIYFSRYPYGREATLGIPAPDLILNNTTDYPVLVWPSYDDTSVTVRIYSTKSIDVEELGQRRSSAGACTHVETDRQRTYEDGRVVVDTIVADYRPAEGIDCAGRAIPDPEG
jgi:vancomycin resistance protein YoaR